MVATRFRQANGSRSATIKTRKTPIGTTNQLWTWSLCVSARTSADSALAPATWAVTLTPWYSPRKSFNRRRKVKTWSIASCENMRLA